MSRARMVIRSSGALLFLVLFSAGAYAQQATVSGTIVDETKAVLPGATVSATNLETGTQASAVSDAAGAFRLERLQPGTYKIQAELSGFSTIVNPKVELLVGQNATVNFTLKVGNLTESVTVLAETPLVDVVSAQAAGNVDRRQMETIPLQGRNWLELSKLVRGVTMNEVSTLPAATDDLVQINLDGQQVSNKASGASMFGQPKFSREAIAEFQIVTSMYDITQGRSEGLQLQAITKSGTNTPSGSIYGYFRSDTLNAADLVSHTVLPYANQQVGGTHGGPVIKDKLHYFASYEYEREPGTIFSSPSLLPGQTFTVPYTNTQHSVMGRVDDQLTRNNRLSVRASVWRWHNPVVLSSGSYPSQAFDQIKRAYNLQGTWSRVARGNAVHEVKLSYSKYMWDYKAQASMQSVPQYRIPGLTIGAPYNSPQQINQDAWGGRYDLAWQKGRHGVKLGGEYLYFKDHGFWVQQSNGDVYFNSVPPNLTSLLPADSALDASRWNILAMSPYVNYVVHNFSKRNWAIEAPRPTWALWLGDNWKLNNSVTLNLGIRWDVDQGMTDVPYLATNSVMINSGVPADVGGMLAGTHDYGYKSGIRDYSDVGPRAGFTYNVGGKNDFVIRAGGGVFYGTPTSNMTYAPQEYSNMVSATFQNDGRADFAVNWLNGVTGAQLLSGAVKAPAQTMRTTAVGFKTPYTWQEIVGFSKQLNDVTGLDVDFMHYKMYRDPRTIDANLYYNPDTGYNKTVSAGRPNPAYAAVYVYQPNGTRDQTQIATGLTRRFKNRFQGGLTYTLMLGMHDDGSIGQGSISGNNPFNILAGEWATSTAFQRHTLRAYTLIQVPWGVGLSVAYSYGSGNRFADSISTTPYGKTGTNRLNLSATGGAVSSITIPESVKDRWNGPMTITSGMVIPRNALEGLPLHKVDLRVTKDLRLGRSVKVQLIGEVFNLTNHGNFGSYNTALNPTNSATNALFGTPLQNTSNAYVSRQGQLAFRVAF
jgi:hypothetical protein